MPESFPVSRELLRIKQISPEYGLLLDLLKGAIAHGKLSPEADSWEQLDWVKFRGLAEYHEVVPVVYPALKNHDLQVSPEVMSSMRDYYYRCLAWCQSLSKEFLRVSDAFRGSGIAVLPLKGVALLSDLYSSSPARTMSDIDILVREADLCRAERVLVGLNYRQELHGLKKEYWRQRHYHLVFHRIDVPRAPVLEVHWMLDYKRNGPELLPRIWERERAIEDAQGQRFAVPSPEDSFFCLALHLRRFGKIQCLKNILDLKLLLEKYERGFDWDYILKESFRGRMRSSVYFSLCQADIIMPGLTCGRVFERLKLSVCKKRMIANFIDRHSRRAPAADGEKNGYLFSQFLLYDGLFEPVRYIINIPQEQFCNYYGLRPYTKKSRLLYRIRFLFILYRLIKGCFSLRIRGWQK
ncbi:MAG: nucleotidyltransferase family protein [Candidatus Omnitrophota bacterium]